LLIVKEGAKFSLVGITLGVLSAFAVTRLLAGELYGVGAMDPITYVGVAMMMTLVTLLACYVPARRALRVDPITALRYE
jgi:ABC-type antimicrobial peptide transport system permease subunit